MDKKSRIFFSVFFFIIFIVVAMSFFKFYILKDYYIRLKADCDPSAEKCFIYECDPAVDTECPENAGERASYYKFIEKKANALPLCDSNDPNCPRIACLPGEDCREILCDEATKTDEEQCSELVEYMDNKENQIQENSEAGR